MAPPSQNIARSRIPPATQGSYFRYFTSRMCGALEPRCGTLKPGALKPGALEPWGAQTLGRSNRNSSVKLVFSYVVKGIKIKITAKFRASRRLRFEDTKRIMLPEIRQKSFGTFEKQAPAQD